MNNSIIDKTVENVRKDNKVIRKTVIVEELPLYSCVKNYTNETEIEDYIFLLSESVKFCLPMWDELHSIDIDRNSDTPFSDFKKAVGEDYECYWVKCLDHSGQYFSLSQEPHRDNGQFTVQNWDTSNVGFCAIPKKSASKMFDTPEKIANMMTNIANGSIWCYDIIDNEKEECIETYWRFLYESDDQRKEWERNVKHAKDVYGIDLESVED